MMKTLDIIRHLPEDCAAFGPCVRNDWMGKQNSNFDLAIPERGMRDEVISKLRSDGFAASKVKSYKATTYRRTEYVIDKGGNRCLLNVYSPVNDDGEEFTVDDVMEARYSADVNRMWMDCTGNIDVSENCGFSFDEVTERLQRGEYRVCDENFGDTEAYDLKKSSMSQVIPKRPKLKYKTMEVPADFVEPRKINMHTQPHINNKEIGKMGTKMDGFMGMVKIDAENAAYRVAAKQISNGVKGAILAILEKQGSGSDKVKAISEMLDTEFGTALIDLVAGMGLTYAPKISEDSRVQRLAGEFRVEGMATAGNAIFDIASQHLLPVVMQAIASLPEPAAETTQVREGEAPKEIEEHEEEAVSPPAKKAS